MRGATQYDARVCDERGAVRLSGRSSPLIGAAHAAGLRVHAYTLRSETAFVVRDEYGATLSLEQESRAATRCRHRRILNRLSGSRRCAVREAALIAPHQPTRTRPCHGTAVATATSDAKRHVTRPACGLPSVAGVRVAAPRLLDGFFTHASKSRGYDAPAAAHVVRRRTP